MRSSAVFLRDQLPEGSARVIDEAGLTTARHEVGYTLTDTGPDFVVLGDSTKVADIEKYPLRPSRVLDSIADTIELI